MVFQLGAQPASACGGVQFCNGPLKAETDYYVKLRAHTEAGFTDTAYSSKIRTGRRGRCLHGSVCFMKIVITKM